MSSLTLTNSLYFFFPSQPSAPSATVPDRFPKRSNGQGGGWNAKKTRHFPNEGGGWGRRGRGRLPGHQSRLGPREEGLGGVPAPPQFCP